jgi:hypothetical protein
MNIYMMGTFQGRFFNLDKLWTMQNTPSIQIKQDLLTMSVFITKHSALTNKANSSLFSVFFRNRSIFVL